MDFHTDMRIVELDSFEAAVPVRPDEEDEVKRTYMTLFTHESGFARLGGMSYVFKAYSHTGKEFAVKRLLIRENVSDIVSLSAVDEQRLVRMRVDSFYEEYRNQLLVSNLRGFPKLYGFGMIGDDPLIVMEWVEGLSLRELARRFDGMSPCQRGPFVARMGLDVLSVLDNTSRLDVTFVHRDLTPSNIMVRTDQTSVEEQAKLGCFDVCLVDFGSAATISASEARFTMNTQIWRMGTPEYAPPEMLTQDIPFVADMRASRAVDVFALCSVLYELYAGHTPWRIAENPHKSAYLVKVESPPERLKPVCDVDDVLVDAIMAGLRIDQGDRPDASALSAVLAQYLAG